MKQTENLGLNLFENTDPVLAENFNANTRKLDAAVTEAKALTESRFSTNKKSISDLAAAAVTVQTGSYIGDGNDVRTLTFPRKPAMVIIHQGNITLLCIHGKAYGVLLNNTSGFGTVSHPVTTTWNDAGKQLTLTKAADLSKNTANITDFAYTWVAFLCDTI